jgi:hypothetical protein
VVVTRDENANGVHYLKHFTSRGECEYVYTDLYTYCDVIEGASLFEVPLLDYKIRKMFFTCIISRIVLLSSGLSRLFQ